MPKKGILRIVINQVIRSHRDNSGLEIALRTAKYLPKDSNRRMDSIFAENK